MVKVVESVAGNELFYNLNIGENVIVQLKGDQGLVLEALLAYNLVYVEVVLGILNVLQGLRKIIYVEQLLDFGLVIVVLAHVLTERKALLPLAARLPRCLGGPPVFGRYYVLGVPALVHHLQNIY